MNHLQGIALRDLSKHEPALRDALSLFDAGKRDGLALHDHATASMLARACCVPHAPWERREQPRALQLFDCTQARGDAGSSQPHKEFRPERYRP